jgi:hypothetical protein
MNKIRVVELFAGVGGFRLGHDSDDIDKSITDIQITKQCFWLNKKLIQEILT